MSLDLLIGRRWDEDVTRKGLHFLIGGDMWHTPQRRGREARPAQVTELHGRQRQLLASDGFSFDSSNGAPNRSFVIGHANIDDKLKWSIKWKLG